jgi:nucleotide-binding universal stress UspA family protein
MFKDVLVGVDGRPNGRDAIALARLLMDPDAQLTLAHAHGDGQGASEEADRLLEQERAGAEVQASLLGLAAAKPGQGLHEQAERQGAELLVVGSCSRGPFGRALLGDDTRATLNGSTCAVAIASRGLADHPAPITRIGVAYNSSPESEVALAAARELAAQTGAGIQVLEVVSIPTAAYTGVVAPDVGETIEVLLQEATERIKQLQGVEGRAVYGLTGEELAAFSEGLDILVVGSRGAGPVRRLVLGSTSEFLERHAHCSLLVLPRV